VSDFMKWIAVGRKQKMAKGASRTVARKPVVLDFRPVLKALFLFVGCPLIILGGIRLIGFSYDAVNVPVENVVVNGRLTYVDEKVVRGIVGVHAASGFLGVKLKEIKRNIENVPGVYRATVSRVWPADLILNIEEEIAVAIWNKHELVSDNGNLFSDTGAVDHSDLPELYGSKNKQKYVMVQYQIFSQLIRSSGLKVKQLEFSKTGAWRAKISNNIEVKLGKEPIVDKMQRFVALYEKSLSEKADQLLSVDLRYTNGVAVAWKRAG